MAIVNMSEFNLFAFDHDREKLLQKLQQFEYVHFLNLDENEELKEDGLESVEVPERIAAIDEEVRKVKYLIDILSNYTEKPTGIKALNNGLETYDFNQLEEKALGIDYLPLYNEIREYSAKKENLAQELNKLDALIFELNPWIKLNCAIKDLDKFEISKVFIGSIPVKYMNKLNNDLSDTKYTYFENLGFDKENLYLLAISDISEYEIVSDILRNNGFIKVKLSGEDTPKNEIEKTRNEISNIKNEIENYENETKKLAANISDLEIIYEYLQNKRLRISASEKFLKTPNVDIIKGYIPSHMIQEFKKVVSDSLNNPYYLEVKDADKNDENVPILLDNSKFNKSFESLTAMYSFPKYNEIDPTPLLAPFYICFFGMMAADIGYGLLMLIGTFVALRVFNFPESTKRFIRFLYYISFAIIFWGVIFGSFFGGIIPMKGLLDLSKDYQSVLILSIALGLIHIFFGLGIKAYLNIRDGHFKDAIYDVGFWYMALTCSILYLLSSFMPFPPIVKTISFDIMLIGMVGILLTGGRDYKSIGGKLAGGLYSLYGISGYIGDLVSYSRLMALGLSGSFIASAINMMVQMLNSKGLIGIIFGAVVFVGGHVFNMGLSMLGAYVHAIRLTFVEFFGKFYEGGGVQFKLFRSNPKYINLK
jgi:V/A-type H+-transporting ATPase subunit I